MKKEKEISLKEYFNISVWSLKILYKMSPFGTISILLCEIIGNLQGLVNSYLLAKLIDELMRMVSAETADIQELFPLLLIFFFVSLFFSLINEISRYSNRMMRFLPRSFFEKMSFEKVNYLGVQTLELPDVATANLKMRDWLYDIPNVARSVMNMVSMVINTVVTGVILYKAVPIVIPFILLASILLYFQRRYFFKKEFDWQTNDENMMKRRRIMTSASRISDANSIGEISIIGAYGYLSKKFTDFWEYFNGGYIDITKKSSISRFFLSILNSIVLLFGFFRIIKLLLEKSISIGSTSFYISAISNFYGSVDVLLAEVVFFRDLVIKIREVYNFFQLEPAVKNGDIKIPRFTEAPLIEIKNVTFHYPNSDKNIFENFSLTIEKGEKLAIVGENGAGKTTLVKLLSRIYDPNEGEILINGTNLKNIDMNDWYKNLGVLFQDFNFYTELTVEENIYIGKSIKELDKKKVVEAAKNADAHEFIMKYENKYDTIMSERFKGGVRPSNGQKQKIAIARFFYRNAPVAIFDEPTSAIDAESEYKIFNRIYEFFKEKTVLIISHRFSTVRNADRIIVIHNGELVEEGTHRELLAKNGRYASAYRKQAEGYKE